MYCPYALMFEEPAPPGPAAHSARLAASAQLSALPPPAYAPPPRTWAADSRTIGELAEPPSVTEHTTNLLTEK